MRPEQESLDIIRKNVDDTIQMAIDEFDREGVRVLEIGLLEGGAKDRFKHATVETLDIIEGGDHVFDLCEYWDVPEELEGAFDVVICCEVLEHVNNPFDAVISISELLKYGGRAYVTTPYNFRIHNPLPDNWRFTEHGLRQLFSNFDVDIKWVGGYELNPICYRLIAQK